MTKYSYTLIKMQIPSRLQQIFQMPQCPEIGTADQGTTVEEAWQILRKRQNFILKNFLPRT